MDGFDDRERWQDKTILLKRPTLAEFGLKGEVKNLTNFSKRFLQKNYLWEVKAIPQKEAVQSLPPEQRWRSESLKAKGRAWSMPEDGSLCNGQRTHRLSKEGKGLPVGVCIRGSNSRKWQHQFLWCLLPETSSYCTFALSLFLPLKKPEKSVRGEWSGEAQERINITLPSFPMEGWLIPAWGMDSATSETRWGDVN